MGVSKRLLLILNPISGKKTGKRHLSDVVEQFCRADYTPTVFVTTGRGNARDLARTHGGEADLVVCLGGDGTFNEVVAGLLDGGHTTPMGYVPCGSTNDFASSIGLKKTIPAATAAILSGTPTPTTWVCSASGISPTWPPSAFSPAPPTPPPRT